LSDHDKLAFPMSLFDELTNYKINKKKEMKEINIFSDSSIRNLTWIQIQLKRKDIENYHLFFLVEFILFITFIIKLGIIKEMNRKNKLLFLSNSFSINENKKIILKLINLIPHFKVLNINEYEQMINSFIKLNKDQQKAIILIGEFILNHEENDKLWNKYQELMEEIKSFLNKMFQ